MKYQLVLVYSELFGTKIEYMYWLPVKSIIKRTKMKNKITEKLKTLFTVVAAMTTFIGLGQEQEERKPPVIEIKEAFEQGLLEFIIGGVSEQQLFREVVDKDGVHYGKCMQIILESKIDSLVFIRIDHGTELIPNDSSFQTMIVTKTVELPLLPNQIYATRFYAMCGQIHDAPPYFRSIYTVGELSDSNTVKLARYFDENYIQNMIGQHALWAYTDEVGITDLEKYFADITSIAMTIEILENLNLETNLNANHSPIHESNIMSVSRYYIYSGLGLLFILATTIVILIVRRKTFDDTVA